MDIAGRRISDDSLTTQRDGRSGRRQAVQGRHRAERERLSFGSTNCPLPSVSLKTTASSKTAVLLWHGKREHRSDAPARSCPRPT